MLWHILKMYFSLYIFQNNSVARAVMQSQKPPKNCREAFTADGDQVFAGRYYSSEYTRPKFLSRDVDSEIRLVCNVALLYYSHPFLLIYLLFGGAGSSLLQVGFLQLWQERATFQLRVYGLLIAVASLVAEHSSRAYRLQQLWSVGLVAPQQVGSSQIGGSNPCLLHWQVDSTTEPSGKPLNFVVFLFF